MSNNQPPVKPENNYGLLTISLALMAAGCFLFQEWYLSIVFLATGAFLVLWLLWTGKIKMFG